MAADTSGQSLQAVVQELALGLRADGADLTATQSGQRIIFELSIPDQACAECVMPASVLAGMFQRCVDTELGPGLTVEIAAPRERSSSL